MGHIIINILFLLFILLLWHFLWKDYAIDKLREDLFSIRNELFNIGYNDNEIDYNHSLYLTFEKILNNTIRYGFRLSFMGAFLFNILLKFQFPRIKVKSRIEAEFNSMIHNLHDKQIKNSLIGLKLQFELSVMKYLLRTSLLFIIIFISNFILYIISEFSIKAFDSLIINAKNKTISNFNNSLIKEIEIQAESLV